MTGQNGDYDYYTCKNCGNHICVNPFAVLNEFDSYKDAEYVPLPLDTTRMSYGNTTSIFDIDTKINIGTIIGGKYELLALVGMGGMTKVFLALDKKINKQWAVKIFYKDLHNNFHVVKNMMIQEADIMKSFDHPAIPRVVDIISTSEYLAIIMDYAKGDTLANVVKYYGAQSVDKVVGWAKQLCDVLDYLYSLNPPHIYRDMKPANVILLPNGKIKIIDFGIMRTYKTNQAEDTCYLRTRGYAAPEQYGGRGQTNARTDTYGLGMTLHHLLTGIDPTKLPYETKPICQINSNLPKGLEYIISKYV